MPKYYFDLWDGIRLERDTVGESLMAEDNARRRAVELSIEVALDQLPEDSTLVCTVRDTEDKLVATAKLNLSLS